MRPTDSYLTERLAVYLVADPALVAGDFVGTVAAAIRGGVTAVQLRAKSLTDRETLALATELRTICHDAGVLFFVNDRIDLAIASGADGVHLGVDDLPLAVARNLAGGEMIIGYSPESDVQTAAARESGADYLGIGPVYGTASKLDAGPAIGLEVIRRRSALAGIPVIGIGGIAPGTVAPVVRSGAAGVAVASAILRADDPAAAAVALARDVQAARALT